MWLLSRPRLRPKLRPRPGVGRGRAPCCARGRTQGVVACCCQSFPGGWHSCRSGVNNAVFLSERLVKGRSDCGHFDLADWGTRVSTRYQAIPALNAHAIRSVGKAIRSRSLHDKVCPRWTSGEPRVCLLTEGTLGRGVNSSGTTERELGLHLFPNWFWWLNCPTQIIGLTSLL
jgi:hypothetical protein